MPELQAAINDSVANSTTERVDDKTAADRIKASLAKLANKQNKLALYNRYYYGNHPFNFASEKFTTEFADRLQSFRDNLCPTVVKAPSDRLEVIGFSSDKKTDLYTSTWAAWTYSEMPRKAKRIHRDAFRTGDAFVTVWQDSNRRGRIYLEDPRNCTVFYDAETGTIEFGAKMWRGSDGFIYLNLYYRDRIEKYITAAKQSAGSVPTTAVAFRKRSVQGEAWPIEVPTNVCPLYHFGLESSILDDVIPLNDALNKTIADMLILSESNSLQQRWSTGIAYEINPETGEQIIPWDQAAKWVASNELGAKFGSFAEGSTEGFLKAADHFVTRAASVSGVPKYYFDLEGGSMPSGEALRKAESRFTALIGDAQRDFGPTWSAVMSAVMYWEGDAAAKAPEGLETQWSPADPLSENEKLDAGQKKKGLGVSTERVLSEIGYTDDDITKMAAENDAAEKKKADRAADSFAKTFNAGGAPLN